MLIAVNTIYRSDSAHRVHTLSHLVLILYTFCAYSTHFESLITFLQRCAHELYMAHHWLVLFYSCFMYMTGPKWNNPRTGSVLAAARRDNSAD